MSRPLAVPAFASAVERLERAGFHAFLNPASGGRWTLAWGSRDEATAYAAGPGALHDIGERALAWLDRRDAGGES